MKYLLQFDIIISITVWNTLSSIISEVLQNLDAFFYADFIFLLFVNS